MLSVIKGQQTYSAPCALLLGGFDGLHVGHASLLAAASASGLPVGLTTLSGNKAGGNLFTLDEREAIFERAGFAFVIEEEFTQEFKEIPAEEYLSSLFARIPAKAVFCGEDFRFGKGACGTPALLKELAPCPVHVLKNVEADNRKIAVSQIKELLRAGEIKKANALLAYEYFVQGEVEHGREEGRKFGFPTLNLSYPANKLALADGVYGGSVQTPAGEFSAVINFGARPTFHLSERKIEAHLVNFSGNLYGELVRVFPAKFLRSVQKFANAEELKIQLQKDIKQL